MDIFRRKLIHIDRGFVLFFIFDVVFFYLFMYCLIPMVDFIFQIFVKKISLEYFVKHRNSRTAVGLKYRFSRKKNHVLVT